MKKWRTFVMAITLGVSFVAAGQTVGPGGIDEFRMGPGWIRDFRRRIESRQHYLYMGVGAGPTQLSTANNEREMDGLSFRFDTDDDDLGLYFILGYWITDNVGLEIGSRLYGTVNVPFEFTNPLDNTSGTGESEVTIDGFNVSLLLGYDLLDDLQIYLRVGALMWEENFESSFYIPGQPRAERETDDTGTGILYGGGIAWRFASTWQLQLQYEMSALDDDDISMASLALTYDFVGLAR